MQNKKEILKNVIKKSHQYPTDIFELYDGTIVVKGMVFENRKAFEKVRKTAKRYALVKKLMFWK